jgi:hypothetical protein
MGLFLALQSKKALKEIQMFDKTWSSRGKKGYFQSNARGTWGPCAFRSLTKQVPQGRPRERHWRVGSSKWDHVVGRTWRARLLSIKRRRLCLRDFDCRRRRFLSSSASPLALLPSRGPLIPSLFTASARRGNGAPPRLPRRPFGRSAAFRLLVAALALAVAQGSWLPVRGVPFSDPCCVRLVD